MTLADALSRRPDYVIKSEDPEEIVMIPKSLIIRLIDTELQDDIGEESNLDELVEDIAKVLRNGPPEARSDLEDWSIQIKDNHIFIFYQNRQYMLKNMELRCKICKKYHDAITAGHPGHQETYNKVAETYWWPRMRQFVKNYVKGCATCQLFKINLSPAKPALMPIEGLKSDRPFANCSMDLIMDLPESDGCDAILSVVDHRLTKGVIFIPTVKTATHEDIAQLLVDNLFPRFRIPNSMISDRDP